MNDVVVEYTSTVVTDQDNFVLRVTDSLRPVNDGAGYQNAFAYQYGVAPSAIASIEVLTDYPGGVTDGDYRDIAWSTDAKGLEAGQDKATVMLYQDNRREGLASGNYTWTVKTAFNGTITASELGLPPYNPFIMTVIFDEDTRAHELHLANYLPTAKASGQWFGKANDVSNPPATYYISNDNYPFAIDLPVQGFALPAEAVQKIDELYPQFNQWAVSKGEQNADWYLHPVSTPAGR
jgi:LruC domain-containing protein